MPVSSHNSRAAPALAASSSCFCALPPHVLAVEIMAIIIDVLFTLESSRHIVRILKNKYKSRAESRCLDASNYSKIKRE